MLSGQIQLAPFDVLQTYAAATVQDTPAGIGNIGVTPDGRRFKLGFNNTASTTLATNKLTQGPASTSALALGTVSAQAIGDVQITYTFAGGASTLTANQLAGGFISVVTGTGSVQTLQIKGHAAATSVTTVILNLADPVVIATASSATAQVTPNPYAAVIICPTSLTGVVTGVNLVAIAAQTFGWFQVSGLVCALGEGTVAQGVGVSPSETTAGAIEAMDANTEVQIGSSVVTGGDGLYSLFNLTLGA